jgi:hypothetical protein
MKMKNLCTIGIAISLATPMAFAREEQLPTMYTATTSNTAVTTTTINTPTIQSLGQMAENNSNKGKSLASAGMTVAAAGVMATCFTPAGMTGTCKTFVLALAATTAVRMLMGNASGTSSSTAAAVTTAADDPYHLASGNGTTTTTVPTTPNYTNDPDWKNAIATIDKLKKDGWKVDLNKGTVTSPDGKKYSTSALNSADSMQAAGLGSSAIKAFENAMAKVPALAAEKMKAADSAASMFDDNVGGGGAKPAAASDGGLTPYGSLAAGTASGQKLGIDRDPAQVAGMSKDFNGNPIGVPQDSVFKMIDRRYELHQKNGSFLSP